MEQSSSPNVPQHAQPDGEPIGIVAGAWAIPAHISTTICATRSPPQCLPGGVQPLPPPRAAGCLLCILAAGHRNRGARRERGQEHPG